MNSPEALPSSLGLLEEVSGAEVEACRQKASQIFHERTDYWSRQMGVRYNQIRIKDQRTLWGSCSRDGNLNFNWRVIMAPPEVLDYLVIHELAHLLEMNHSRRFWAHVGLWCPEHHVQRRWLRENSRELRVLEANRQ